jgi:hypothetical protein
MAIELRGGLLSTAVAGLLLGGITFGEDLVPPTKAADPEAKAESKAKSKSESKSESKAESKADSKPEPKTDSKASPTTEALASSVLLRSALPKLEALPNDWRSHPLMPALILAAEYHQYMLDSVQDFRCVLVKRERINGRLRDYDYIATKVRRQELKDGKVVKPYAVYMQFLAPRKLRGRIVIYVEGQNDNKMVVRNGGTRFDYVTLKIAKDSEAALRETHYPITELGLVNVVSRLAEQVCDDIVADPLGENTTVAFFRGAKIDERSCTHIRVTHPQKAEGLDFHIANVYVDEELRVPIRVEGFDWPAEEGGDPILMEEYTYTKLKLNVGFTDDDFSLDLLK